ncbi:MAG: hypothetical protein QOJ69_1478 [Actinomycetota bacterium]|nr:hypothetical protein [Actinomycetota bacterium]
MSGSKGRRRLIAGAITAAAFGLAGTGLAVAQSGGTTQPGGDTKPAYTSSVTVADTGTENEANDAALAGLAKISPDQAKAAALAAVPGTAGQVALEDENGNVVFGVEITAADGTKTDVKVDAGNGTVLAQEAEDANESGADESDQKGGAETESPTEAPAAPSTTP